MVQIIPNWATVSGRIEAAETAPDSSLRLRVRVDSADDIPGFANLLGRNVGSSIDVDVGPGSAAMPAPGLSFRARLRQTGVDTYRAEPSSVSIL
jgi:hypothetical protein